MHEYDLSFFLFFLTKHFILFIYFWLCWVFVLHVGFLQLQRARATLHCGAQALGSPASVVVALGLYSCQLSSCGT